MEHSLKDGFEINKMVNGKAFSCYTVLAKDMRL